MKKGNLLFLLAIFIVLCTLKPLTLYAEEIHSEVNGVLLPADESIDTTGFDDLELKYSEMNSSRLPQAGEKINWKIQYAGFIIFLVSSVILARNVRRISNEKQ